MRVIILISLIIGSLSFAQDNQANQNQDNQNQEVAITNFNCEDGFSHLFNKEISTFRKHLIKARDIVSNPDNYKSGMLNAKAYPVELLKSIRGYRNYFSGFNLQNRTYQESPTLNISEAGQQLISACISLNINHPIIDQLFNEIKELKDIDNDNGRIECINNKENNQFYSKRSLIGPYSDCIFYPAAG